MCTEKRALLSILLLFIINVIIVIILIIGAFVYTISYLRLRCIPLIHRVHGRKLRVAFISRGSKRANREHAPRLDRSLPPLLGFRNPKNLRVKFSPAVSVFLLIAEENETKTEEMTTTTKRRDSTKGMLAILCLVL